MQDSQGQLWLPVERRMSPHMQPFTCDKSGSFEQGFWGFGAALSLAEFLIAVCPTGCATGCSPSS